MTKTQPFEHLQISPKLLSTLSELGYENPTPIQEQSIPVLLEGKDLLAQAQTGTGKTAAFALPILTRISLKDNYPQALVLAPTRELAIQVAEAFKSYARNIHDFRVLAIYGGQDYSRQIKALKRGVHVVVGTPGRVMDHLRRGTLNIERINTFILDEADEMLKMGFIEDVAWILKQIPASQPHQTALFSATIPSTIRNIASQYLKNPTEIRINPQEKTIAAIKQYCMLVYGEQKLAALTYFLELEEFDSILIFTRTKNSSTELAEKLEARGYATAALNGDMSQSSREKVIAKIKNKSIDIIVATDVAARGLDIERLSHVISYDVPYDTESYVHRIGRTGRAGREGKALLLVTPRERRMLRDIENAVKQPISVIAPPSATQINEKRTEKLTSSVLEVLAKNSYKSYYEIIEKITQKCDASLTDIAAAFAFMSQKGKQLDKNIEKFAEFSSQDDDRGHERRNKKSRNFKGDSRKKSFSKGDKGRRSDKGVRNDKGSRSDISKKNDKSKKAKRFKKR